MMRFLFVLMVFVVTLIVAIVLRAGGYMDPEIAYAGAIMFTCGAAACAILLPNHKTEK